MPDGIMTTTALQSVYIILAIVAMVIIVLVVLYIVTKIKSSQLNEVVMHDKIINLDDTKTVPYKIDSDKFASKSVGQEYSYSFWLYLSDQYDATQQHKLIFARGNKSTIPNTFSFTSNPIVFLDRTSNKLYIATSTSYVKADSPPKTFDEILQKKNDRYESGYMISSIEYVPLQRWVNITFFIKDDKLLLFLDGDMYSATTVNDVYSPMSSSRAILRATQDDAVIGDKTTTKGFLAMSRYYNYALTHKEIKSIYESGPVKKSLLSLLGLGQYGVRTPIYNINEDAKN